MRICVSKQLQGWDHTQFESSLWKNTSNMQDLMLIWAITLLNLRVSSKVFWNGGDIFMLLNECHWQCKSLLRGKVGMESVCYYTVFFLRLNLINFEFLVKTTYNIKISVVVRIPFMKMHYVTLLYWEGQFSPVTTSLRVNSHFPGSWELLFLKWNINTYDFVKAKREIPPHSDFVLFYPLAIKF